MLFKVLYVDNGHIRGTIREYGSIDETLPMLVDGYKWEDRLREWASRTYGGDLFCTDREVVVAVGRSPADDTVKAVLRVYQRAGYRGCVHGHDVHVTLGKYYSLKCKTSVGGRYSSQVSYPKRESQHYLTVRSDWLARSAAYGLDLYDSMLVLDIVELGHTADKQNTILKLALVKQGRGTSLYIIKKVVSGRDGEFTSHKIRKSDVIYENEGIAHDAVLDADLISE